uniref:Eukaryotic translation initiation factor 3 subunit D-like n=1 Tax=Piliocolobus tephrosceles TaxID=591936 RepID=A0A8C9GD92_9PRIM
MYNKQQTTQAFTKKQKEEDILYSSKIKTAEQKKQKIFQQAKMARINARHRMFTEWSIEPTPSWTVECELMFNELPKKVIKPDSIKIEDVGFKGKVLYYDKKIENISIKNPPVLLQLTKDISCVICKTVHDQTLMEMVAEEEKTMKENKNDSLIIVSTDQILACLMSAVHSKYSWHLTIEKKGKKIIIDKEDNSIIDLLTVNENSIYAPTQDNENKANNLQALGYEAIKINEKFRKQVLIKNDVAEQFGNVSFKNKQSKTQDVLYRYRKVYLPPLMHSTNKTNYILLTRGEIHAKNKGSNNSYIYVCTLNEYILKSHKNWRSQIENQKGALLANEIKNNTCKLHKFICQALLSSCEDIKLGFVSRKSANDSENHNILSIQSYKTKDFGSQIGLKEENVWGILRFIIDNIADRPDAKYVVLKDPLKSLLRLYC